jgi:hypothetical protein
MVDSQIDHQKKKNNQFMFSELEAISADWKFVMEFSEEISNI